MCKKVFIITNGLQLEESHYLPVLSAVMMENGQIGDEYPDRDNILNFEILNSIDDILTNGFRKNNGCVLFQVNNPKDSSFIFSYILFLSMKSTLKIIFFPNGNYYRLSRAHIAESILSASMRSIFNRFLQTVLSFILMIRIVTLYPSTSNN